MGLISSLRELDRARRFALRSGEVWGKSPLPEIYEEPFASAFKTCREPENFRLRLWHECKVAEMTLAVEGAWLFVGVSHGRSAHCALRYLGDRARHRRLILLDSWTAATGGKALTGNRAEYCTDVGKIREAFAYHEPVEIVEGLAPAALSQVVGPLSYVVFDTAVMQADVDSLPLVWPLISPGGVILLNRAYRHAHETPAYRAAMQALLGGIVLPLLTGSAAVFKSR